MWNDLRSGEEIILTNNGRPSALVINISEGNFDETIRSVRQAKAMNALNNMRRKAFDAGYLTDDEIESMIDEARDI